VKSSVDDLLSQIAAHEGKPMEVSHWALLFVFDVMGKVGFSEDWGAVKDGRPNPILHLLEALFTPLGRLGRWIWPIGFFVDTGLGNEDREAFEAWSNKLLAVRQKVCVRCAVVQTTGVILNPNLCRKEERARLISQHFSLNPFTTLQTLKLDCTTKTCSMERASP